MKEFKKEIKNVKIKTDRSNLKCPFCGSKHVYIHSCENILLKNQGVVYGMLHVKNYFLKIFKIVTFL